MNAEATVVTDLQRIKVGDLKSDMDIYAYVGFGKKYQKIDDKTKDWLIVNFKGVRAVIARSGQRLDIKLADLQSGDQLLRLHQFPGALKKLIQVNDRLIAELKQREFLSFEAKNRPSKTTSKQIRHQQAVRRTEELIEKTKKSIGIRDQLVQETEEFLDTARQGKFNLSGLVKHARDITDESLSEAISAISGLKASDQTYAHSIDVSVIFHTALSRINQRTNRSCLFQNDEEILIGGFLHDIGKSKVPKEILESKEKYDPDGKEMQLIRKHPEFGAELLSKMKMPDPVINIALCHHLKLEKTLVSNYPKSKNYRDSKRETRLLSVVDIFQALIGKRSYKRPWTPASAMNYISQLVGIEHDSRTFGEFYQVMGMYPVGSLVELTDGSLAFVTSVPRIDLKRPQVVVVRNAKGEDLENHTLIDLQEEPELAIAKDISSYEVFGEDALQRFVELHVS